MSTVSNRVIAYLASPYAGGALAQSANHTVTIAQQTAERLRVPIYVAHPGSQSNPPEVLFYLSNDGGTSFETIATTGFSFTRNPAGTDRRIIDLDGGVWAIKIVTGGIPHTNYSCTVAVQTVEVLTAYIGV